MTTYPGRFLSDRMWVYGNTLVVTDLHYDVGCSGFCQKRILSNAPAGVDTIILNGDIVNSFPPSENALEMIKSLPDRFDTIIYHEGNHEQMVGGIKSYLPDGIEHRTYTKLSGPDGYVVVTHGHEIDLSMNLSDVSYIIMGHIHPTTDSGTPCAIKGEFKYDTPANTEVIVMPAFGHGISNLPYTQQEKDNDFIEDIPSCSVIHRW